VLLAGLAALVALGGCATKPRDPTIDDQYPTHYDDQDYFDPEAEAGTAQAASSAAAATATAAAASAPAAQSAQSATAAQSAPAATAAPTGPVGPERYLPRATKREDNLQSILQQPTQRQGAQASTGTDADVRPEAVAMPSPAPSATTLRVHVMNVGTGSCQILECPGSDDVMVVDCGTMDAGPTDLSRGEIAGYLQSLGVSGDVKVVLTHPHENHYNRIPTLMGERQAASIWLGGGFEGYGGAAPDRIDDWLDRQAALGTPIYVGFPSGYANRGVPVEGLSCGTANVYILTVNVGDDPDGGSLALLVQHDSFRIVLPGDADGATEASALSNFGSLIADASVVVASRHGTDAGGSNHGAWTGRTAPQTVVFSTGTAHGQPARGAGERYLESVFDNVAPHPIWWSPAADGTTPLATTDRAVYATALSGRIVIDSDGQAFTLVCGKDGTFTRCF
jgi:beta-lactamase superfamily II metal-dependent hydrolase